MTREQAHEAAKRKVFIVDDKGEIVRPKTPAERDAEDRAEALIASRAKAAAEDANALAREKKTPAQTYAEHVESLDTYGPGMQAQQDTRRKMAADWRAKEIQEEAIEKRQRQIANDPGLKIVREHAEAFNRTPPPFADSESVNLAVALANSTEFDDPEKQSEEYWRQVKSIESDALVRQKDETSRLESESAKANALAARAKATELESQIRVTAVDSRLSPNAD